MSYMNDENDMMSYLISDIDKALDAGAYMAALSLMLTLPDICASVEYGMNRGNKERYVKWYEENVGKYQNSNLYDPEIETKMPYISGEVFYQLRCSFLHQGNPNIDTTKINDPICKIDSFVIIVETKKERECYVSSASVSNFSNSRRGYEMNIRHQWFILKSAVTLYYKENKERFNFFNYTIKDFDKEMEKWERIKKINEELRIKLKSRKK